ncbi:MAG: hypothetical protein ACI4KM_01985 [Oscillospiraceae bacterium]
METVDQRLDKIIEKYKSLLQNVDDEAAENDERAYGGYIRAEKGKLVESIASELVEIAWTLVLKQDKKRLEMNQKKMPIRVTDAYIDGISDQAVREHIKSESKKYFYNFGTDVQVYIDGKLVLPIECKTYTENAMLKRILFDAMLMKKAAGTQTYYLLQLESQLGGDYSELNDVTYGSPATHALLAQLDVDLKIITLLKGERKVDKPIHKPEFYKELNKRELQKALDIFAGALRDHI